MDTNFFEHIHRTLLQYPEQVFVVWPASGRKDAAPTSHTGQAILGRVQAMREALATTPVQPAEAVLLALPVGMDLLCALLAVMALGAVPVLPPAAASPKGLLHLVRQVRIRTVVTQRPARLATRCVAWVFGVQMTAIGPVGSRAAAAGAAAPVPKGQAALVSHTSGSTGQPKAIHRSHGVLLAQHQALKAVFPPWAGQRDFPLFPNILLHNLAAGVVSILPDVPGTGPLVPARLVQQLVQERVQTLTGNVAYFAALLGYLRQHPVRLPDVVGIGIGGSPVPEPLVQALLRYFPSAAVYIIYGSSEAEPIAVRRVSADPANPGAGYCVGAVHPALECRIRPVGQLRRGADAGQDVGEIQVRGPHVASSPPGQWLNTGDYGYLAGGQLFLTGRQGNERLHHGVQHYQVEHVLYHLPGVERVAARADATGFTLFVEGSATRQAIAAELASVFPANLCRALHFRTHLPVDARHHSKILYDQLR